MQQVQFFAFGLFVIWLTSSGKLRALWNAFRSTPPADTGSKDGGAYIDPNTGKLMVPGPDGKPLEVYI